MKRVGLLVIMFTLAACQSVPRSSERAVCPEGWWVKAHVYALGSLPPFWKEQASWAMAEARRRDTRGATDPQGYRGKSYSRDILPELVRIGHNPAPVSFGVEMYSREATGGNPVLLGIMNITIGEGTFRLPSDPRGQITEAVWPDGVLSPIRSGGRNRLWVSGDEWTGCRVNVGALLP